MSNPLRAPTDALTDAQTLLNKYMPDATLVLKPTDLLTRLRDGGKNLMVLQALLPLSLKHMPALMLTPDSTTDDRVRRKAEPTIGLTDVSGFTARRRSVFGKKMATIWGEHLPSKAPPGQSFAELAVCQARASVTMFAGGGSHFALGRLQRALPPSSHKIRVPVTIGEAKTSLESTGLYPLEEDLYGVFDPARPVAINKSSDNGFPVLGKFEGEGAAMCLGLVQTYQPILEEQFARGGRERIFEYVRMAELDPKTAPYFTLRGKVKSDYYKLEKVAGSLLRFYNVVPRHLALMMQEVTQPYEQTARNILDHESYHSFSGASMCKRGAHKLAVALDQQVRAQDANFGFVTMGDDSLVVLRLGARDWVMFALDCSNFDLTQSGQLTETVHAAMADQMQKKGGFRSALWYTLMRGRSVVVARSLTCFFSDAGPSGMPLQSKVNNVLMDVMIRRLLTTLDEEAEGFGQAASAEELDRVIQRVGKDMGFAVRLEQYARHQDCGSVFEFLRENPMLFVGYYLYATEELVRHNGMDVPRVAAFADLPRCLSQMPYPSNQWTAGKETFEQTEAVRLGSIFLAMGEPPPCLREAYEAAREYACELLVRAQRHGEGALDVETLRWAIMENPVGPPVIPTLKGIYRAVIDAPEIFTREVPEEELGGESRFLYPGDSAVGFIRPKKMPVRPPRERTAACADAHGATRFNAGRPPSMTFWQPDRQPRDEDGLLRGGKRVRRRRDGGDWEGDGFESERSDDDQWSESDGWEAASDM